METKVAIIGTSAVPVGKYQTEDTAAVQVVEHEILLQLVVQACRDAGVEKDAIDSLVFTLPRPYTRQKYFHTFVVGRLNLKCTGTIMEVMGNGMTASLAVDQAANEILLGRAKVALALGINMESATPAVEHMMSSMRTTGDVDFHASAGFTPISWYAMDAMRYMYEYGATREQIASVAVKNRFHASLNPLAQYRKTITLKEVLDQRYIVEPLGLYEVPPRGDGAACLVLASEAYARELGVPYALIRGRGFAHDGAHQIDDRPGDMIRFISAERACRTAYEQAGVASADIDLAELYAPCTIVEILAAEAAGLMPRGTGARQAAEGATTLGGRIPLSTSGGFTSRGHPAYVTSLYSYVEVLDQLRHRAGARQVKDANLALVTGELGNYNAALAHVLEARE